MQLERSRLKDRRWIGDLAAPHSGEAAQDNRSPTSGNVHATAGNWAGLVQNILHDSR